MNNLEGRDLFDFIVISTKGCLVLNLNIVNDSIMSKIYYLINS